MDSTTRLRNIKVGIAAVVAFALLALSYYFVGALRLSARSYSLFAVFSDVQGIDQGTPVMIAGVKIGYVKNVRLNERNKAEVELRIRHDQQVPRGSTVRIASVSMLGDKFIEVIPGPTSAGSIQPNERLAGASPFNIDNLLVQVSGAIAQLDKLGASATNFLNDPALRLGINSIITRVEQTSGAALALVNELRGVVGANQDEVSRTARNIEDSSANLSALLGQLESVARGAKGEDLAAVMTNIRVASKKLEEAVASAAAVAADTKVQEDLRASVRNTRDATESAKAVVDRVATLIGAKKGAGDGQSTSTPAQPPPAGRGTKLDLLYDTRHGRSRVDINHDLQLRPDSFYRFGIYDIGENARINLQAGKIIDPFNAYRIGIYQSRLGIGYDWQAAPGRSVQADLYRPNDLRLDVKGRVDLSEDVSGWLGVEGLLGGEETPVMGLQYRF